MAPGSDPEITLQDGRRKRLNAGEALAEVVDTAHNGRNVGDGPVRLVVFYAGAVVHPLTIREVRRAVASACIGFDRRK